MGALEISSLLTITMITILDNSLVNYCSLSRPTGVDCWRQNNNNLTMIVTIVGHGGALVESIAFNRRVVGSTPALAAM